MEIKNNPLNIEKTTEVIDFIVEMPKILRNKINRAFREINIFHNNLLSTVNTTEQKWGEIAWGSKSKIKSENINASANATKLYKKVPSNSVIIYKNIKSANFRLACEMARNASKNQQNRRLGKSTAPLFIREIKNVEEYNKPISYSDFANMSIEQNVINLTKQISLKMLGNKQEIEYVATKFAKKEVKSIEIIKADGFIKIRFNLKSSYQESPIYDLKNNGIERMKRNVERKLHRIHCIKQNKRNREMKAIYRNNFENNIDKLTKNDIKIDKKGRSYISNDELNIKFVYVFGSLKKEIMSR